MITVIAIYSCLSSSFISVLTDFRYNTLNLRNFSEGSKNKESFNIDPSMHVGRIRTPFVNRHREITELAAYNAEFVYLYRQIVSKKIKVSDYRGYRFVFAAQMFGAGKSRLGESFIEELPHILQENAYPMVDMVGDSEEDAANIRKIATHFAESGILMSFDLSSCRSFGAVSELICGERLLEPFFLGKALKKICVEAGRPVMFMFDECGDMTVDKLRDLRVSCRSVLQSMSLDELNKCFPFFYFCGRGLAYDQLGSKGSPVGSHWIILEPLQRDHVKKIVMESTGVNTSLKGYRERMYTFHKNLTPDEFDRLIDHVIDWTAGAPRGLLYVLCIIEQNYRKEEVDIRSEVGLESLFQDISNKIDETPTLKSELGMIGRNSTHEQLTKKELDAYRYYCYLSIIGHKFYPNSHSDEIKNDDLRSFNVFLKKNGASCFNIVVPRFVKSKIGINDTSLAQKYSNQELLEQSILPVAMFYLHCAGSANIMDGFRPLFSDQSTVEICKICELNDIEEGRLHLWEKRGPKVHRYGTLTDSDVKRAVSDRSFAFMSGQLKVSSFPYFLELLPVGDALVMGDKSSSADVIVKLSHQMVMEIQTKNTKDTQLNLRKLEAEMIKSVVFINLSSSLSTVFVYLSVNLSFDDTLILKGGYSYNSNSNFSVVAFPDGESGSKDSEILRVPEKMTLVIPAHKDIKNFLGNNIMMALNNQTTND